MSLTLQTQQAEQMMIWDCLDQSSRHATDQKHSVSQEETSAKVLNGISLFAGAGGMDVGFIKAGVNVVKANELIPHACDTYAANHPETKLLRGDINSLMDNFASGDAEIIFGGPPCQGFSVAGKMNPNDERSQLIWSFLEVVKRVKPHIFVMENVKALGKLEKWKPVRDKFIQQSNNFGYFCDFFILNAADFGVSQNRERVFFIGSLKPYNSIALGQIFESLKEEPLTLRKLFETLPLAGSEENPFTCTAKITLASNPVLRKSPYAGMIFNGMGRPLNLESVSSTLPASMGGNKTPIVDCVLLADASATDWIREYHAKLWGGAIDAEFTPAPEHLRRLTIRESAAIQSFPDDYVFCGTKSSIYTQIGNAVPCKLAQRIAEALITYFY